MSAIAAAIASGVIAGVGNLAGGAFQQHKQKDLMDYNAALNLEQWNRENAYNSPAAQMARLREAGLNPDLAIGGNVANTAGHADMTSGTPHAPNTSGLGSAIMQGALNASQVNLNDAAAVKNIAEAGKAESETKGQDIENSYLDDVMTMRLVKMFHEDGLTQAETNLKIGQFDEVMAHATYLSALVPNVRADTRLKDSQQRSEEFRGDLLKYDAGVRLKELQRFDEMFDARLQEMFSQTKSNNAYAAYTRQQIRFINDAWLSLLSQEENKASLLLSESQYYDSLSNNLRQQYQWFPIQNINAYMRYRSVVEESKEGYPLRELHPTGEVFPVLKGFSKDWDNAMHYVNGAMGVLNDMSLIYRNIGAGTAGFRGGYINVQTPGSVQPGVSSPAVSPKTSQQSSGFSSLYNLDGSRKTYKNVKDYWDEVYGRK